MRPSVQQQCRQTGHSEATTRARICLGCVHLYNSSAGRLDILNYESKDMLGMRPSVQQQRSLSTLIA